MEAAEAIDQLRELTGKREADALSILLAFGEAAIPTLDPDEKVRERAVAAFRAFEQGVTVHAVGDECLERVSIEGHHVCGVDGACDYCMPYLLDTLMLTRYDVMSARTQLETLHNDHDNFPVYTCAECAPILLLIQAIESGS